LREDNVVRKRLTEKTRWDILRLGIDMTIDLRVCSRARLSRDARFDGKFFIGVVGSMVYCRPICPAPTAKEKNVRYFATAAAAAEAGFRPCLRCRPECSPGTPAWVGTPNTVARALRLISESGLEDGGVEALAERLGVGARHLRRLFLKHLGATPSAVAQTRRLHFAKKLIDETNLRMSEVALAAGFGCVRRFNESIRKTYHRTPRQIRSLVRKANVEPENQYLFRLRYRPPYSWSGMLSFLEARAVPGVESVENGIYSRSISLGDSQGNFEVALDERNSSLAVRVQFGDPRSLFQIVERIRAMFDLNADWAAIESTLRTEPKLARQIKAHPGLRVPGCWDGFELAIRAVLGQQITVKGATALAGRLAKTFGQSFSAEGALTHIFPKAEVLSEADVGSIGLPAARAATVRLLARSVCDGRVRFDGILDVDDFVVGLCEIPGIGKWTAQYIAMRALGEPDAFPSGDLGLLRALGLTSVRELERRAEAWRPWRSYATVYLWSIAAEHSLRGSDRVAAKSKSSAGDEIDSNQRFPLAV
jgi:AraC family transcriptional regulator of adaptative response / DNA-3-methyladenine glycosylase II